MILPQVNFFDISRSYEIFKKDFVTCVVSDAKNIATATSKFSKERSRAISMGLKVTGVSAVIESEA